MFLCAKELGVVISYEVRRWSEALVPQHGSRRGTTLRLGKMDHVGNRVLRHC